MNVKIPIIAGIMSLSSIGICNAQKPVQISTEAGVTADFNKELVYQNGLHAIFSNENNNTDVYCGMLFDTEKNALFEGQLENEYNWTQCISSWIRETFHLSNKENNLTSEFAPAKINMSYKKFDTYFAPVYIMENDFKDKSIFQDAGVVLGTFYNVDENNSLNFEAEYKSEPAKNIFKSKFGKLKDNISYMLTYIRNF